MSAPRRGQRWHRMYHRHGRTWGRRGGYTRAHDLCVRLDRIWARARI